MGTVDEKQSLESVNISFVGAQSENSGSDMVMETSSEDSISEKDTKKLYGVKRARSTDDEQKSSLVHVAYSSLPRKSKKKLEELLLGWSEWHSQHLKKDSDEELESGQETYFPALNLGADKSPPLSFLSDVPLIKKHCKGLTAFDKELVPLYDRGYTAPLCSNDSGPESKRGLEVRKETRCFNCGSYDHSLKDCSKPRDNDAITNARKQHQANKKGNGRPRILTRYFQESPAGKYDGLKQGSLSAETKHLLGIGEHDPLPWHHRMRELGYPPGYTDVDAEAEEQPSGITIVTGDETMGAENNDIIISKISKTVEITSACFPGADAPTAKNSGPVKWVAPHPLGVDIPAKKPNLFTNSELYYRRQMAEPTWADRDLRFSRSFGVTSPPDSFERDYRDARLLGRFGADAALDNLFRDDRDYRDDRFSGSFSGSPKFNSFWAVRDYREDMFSRPSPNYFSRSYPSHMTDGDPPRDFSQGIFMGRSPDRRGSSLAVHERLPFHSPLDHFPFSFSPPDNSPVFPTQAYGRHHLHDDY